MGHHRNWTGKKRKLSQFATAEKQLLSQRENKTQTKVWLNQKQQAIVSPLNQKTSSVLISGGKSQWTYM